MQTLKKHGLERFDPSAEEGGAKFDPNLHEATFQAPVPGKEDGTVMHTMQKGFVLNGRVLRVSLLCSVLVERRFPLWDMAASPLMVSNGMGLLMMIMVE